MLLDALRRNLPKDALSGVPTKKQRMEEGTPLKHFLRPIIEETMVRRMAMMQNMQPSPQTMGGMVEPPPVNPLQNALGGGNLYAS